MQLPMEAEYAWNLVGGSFSYAVLRVQEVRCSESVETWVKL